MKVGTRKMDKQERAAKVEAYGKAYDLLTEALQKFPKEMWDFEPTQGWSIRQIVVHITDSEANSFVRCRRLVAEPGSAVLGYNEETWAKTLHYEQQDADDALQLFKWLRLTSYKLIKAIPESTWAHTIEHSENGTMTMEDWLNVYSSHVPDHISQMQAVYNEWKEQNV